MNKPRSSLRNRAEQLCKEMGEDCPSRTIAKRLKSEFGVAVNLEQCRSIVRVIRGNSGKVHRKKATQPRTNRKAGMVAPLPPSLAEPWVPVELDGKRVAILSDVHIPYHSSVAVTAAIKYAKTRKPDTILLNGDIGDFYSQSRYEKNPAKRDLVRELEMLEAFLVHVRQQFPKARIIYKEGNHDFRWKSWLWAHAAEISDHPRMRLDVWLNLKDHGIEWVADERPIMAGKLPIFHGHELGKSGIANPVNPARGAFMRTHHTILVGHSHVSSHHVEPNVWHEEVSCWSTGCLCDLTPQYARVNKWCHGFAFVDVSPDGSFDVDNLRINLEGTVRRS